jgi:hypothetical protein
MRLTALCMLSAFGDQILSDGPMRGGVRMLTGLLAAETVLEIIMMTPSALFG